MQPAATLSLAAALVAVQPAPASPAAAPATVAWLTDLPAALAQAEREGKLVLIEFTGSDWCTYCIELKRTVLSTPAFAAFVAPSFVPVEIDVPIRRDFDQELLKRNQDICQRLKVPGYPTLMVLTPQGQVVGGFRGNPKNGLEGVKQHLATAQKAARILAEAEKLEGVDKAKALHSVYEALEPCMRPSTGLRERIVALDPDNVTGVRHELEIEAQRAAFRKELAATSDPKLGMAIVERYLKDAYPQNLAEVMNAQVAIILATAQTVDDVLAAKTVLLKICELTPETAERDKADFEKRFANPQEVLDYVKEHPPIW